MKLSASGKVKNTYMWHNNYSGNHTFIKYLMPLKELQNKYIYSTYNWKIITKRETTDYYSMEIKSVQIGY